LAGAAFSLLHLVWRLLLMPRLVALLLSLASRVQDRYDRLFSPESERHEGLLYLFYYWRARLRWYIRLLLVIVVLIVSWYLPTLICAALVIASSVFAIWITPHTPWSPYFSRPAVAGLAVLVWLFLWNLPRICTMLFVAALGRQCLLAFRDFRRGVELAYATEFLLLGAVAILLGFVHLPRTLLSLLAVVTWGFFLILLPKLCLALTEFGVSSYYYPFLSVFSHLTLLGALLSYETPTALIPCAIFLLLFWFFPKIVGVFIGLFVLNLLLPSFYKMRDAVLAMVAAPYGSGTPPDKIKTAEEAVGHVQASTNHYDTLNCYREASSRELKANYRRMALLLHPDKNPDDRAAVAFKQVTDAWEVLSDLMQRAEYDAAADGGDEEEEAAEGDRERSDRGVSAAPAGPPGLKKRRPRKR